MWFVNRMKNPTAIHYFFCYSKQFRNTSGLLIIANRLIFKRSAISITTLRNYRVFGGLTDVFPSTQGQTDPCQDLRMPELELELLV